MTLRLILTRHAKSDWGDMSIDDHDRPLNDRGRRSAVAIGRWLKQNGYAPEQALVSTALRTRETWELVSAQLDAPPRPDFISALYHAGAQDMLDTLRKQGKSKTVMMVGHNPGTGTMAAMLASERPSDPAFAQYPTAYTSVFGFAADDWKDVDWQHGDIVATIAARTLLD